MSSPQRKIDWALAALALLLSSSGIAQGVQDVDTLRHLAANFAQQRLGASTDSAKRHVEPGVLDSRLRLPPCSRAPAAFAPSGELRATARLTIGVRCEQPQWTVYVPVTVETELTVLVTRKALPRSAAVQAEDVELQQRRVPGTAVGYITSQEQLAGRHLRGPAAPGTALTVELLAADILIRRGQRVTLVAMAGSLEVRAQGEAVSDALPDGRIRVLNLSSNRIVEGHVQSRDRVRVSL
jgi:flagellar basal body P-ring formation protein FlgA